MCGPVSVVQCKVCMQLCSPSGEHCIMQRPLVLSQTTLVAALPWLLLGRFSAGQLLDMQLVVKSTWGYVMCNMTHQLPACCADLCCWCCPGFVSSLGKDGSVNLAPYSYFNAMGHNPCIVALGISRSPGRGGGKKDTLQNIEETKWALPAGHAPGCVLQLQGCVANTYPRKRMRACP